MLSFLLLTILKFAKSAQITGWVYADNWFELYFNGEKVATDPLTFYPHNAVYINFTAPDTGLYSFALWAQDFANDTTGLEPRILSDGSNGGWCIGDGGFRLSLSDGTVSGSNWECLVIMEGPTNAECGNPAECISAQTKPTDCTVTYNPYPSCWNETFCAQATSANGWVTATEYTEADIGYGRPPNAVGYNYTYPDICGSDPIYATEGCLPADKFRNDQTSKFMWTSDLNFDNRIMCRYSYCVGGGTSCLTTPNPTTPSPVTPAPVTPNPTTSNPTTAAPITSAPTTTDPTTASPITADPTTATPTTTSPTSSSVEQVTPWDTLKTTTFAFIPAPTNQSEAERLGWTVIMDCSNPQSPGIVYWDDGDLAAMPIYNTFGQISGFIVGIDDPGQNAQKTPWKQYTSNNNTSFWGITAFFRDPDTICNAASASDIEYGDRLWIVDGDEGSYTKVPLNESEAVLAAQGWIEGGCKDGAYKMGVHYWRYFTVDMDCNDAYPVFILYDNGILHAYGVAMGNTDRPYPTSARWEHPRGDFLTSFFQPGESPTCLPEQSNLYNSMHVYMTSSVLNKTTTCPAITVDVGPTEICINHPANTIEQSWDLDGTYYKLNQTENGYPIWWKQGYTSLANDYYIFLDDNNGTDEYKWTITNDIDEYKTNSDSLFGRCSSSNILEPTLCPSWNTTVNFTADPDMTVSEGNCTYDIEDYLCINSTEFHLAGLAGTYQQRSENRAIWFHEKSDCDYAQAVLYWVDDGFSPYFGLYDLNTGYFQAECTPNVSTAYNATNWDAIKYHPEQCETWYTHADDTSPLAGEQVIDETLTITRDSMCTAADCVISSTIPDSICISETVNNQGWIEGTYIKTDTVGPYYGFSEWKKTGGIHADTYIWNRAELHTVAELSYHAGWYIADRDLLTAIADVNASGSFGVYARCDANVLNPLDCRAGWKVWFGGFFLDEFLKIEEGNCSWTTTTEPPLEHDWPECIQIGLFDEDAAQQSVYLPVEYFMGFYTKNETTVKSYLRDYYGIRGTYPIWSKTFVDDIHFNVSTTYQVDIFFSEIYSVWLLGDTNFGVQLICYQSNITNPSECNAWFDFYGVKIDNMEWTLYNDSCPVTPGYHCSALDAYIQVMSTASNESETITSAQALFPPYTYYIPYTELTVLDDTDDDPCSVTGINTDINNTIVLLFESKGSCSNHEKVYIAEQQGAVAVLIANNDNSGGVTTIIDDDDIVSSIPMRSIPYRAGIELQLQLLAGESVEIHFGCFDDFNDFPSDVCLLDTEGERWYLDGVYQRQANWEIHDHPVWKKEGYGWILGDFYMHLIDANGDDEWYWAITREEDSWGFYNETLIAFCDVSGISEPSLCPMWNLTNRTTEQSIGNYPFFNISNGLCVEDDEDFICINSDQSNLGGISGTYQLYNKATPFWFRDISDCDSVIAYLYWDEGAFIIQEFATGFIAAGCFMNQTKYDNTTWETVKFRPDLCTEWYSIDNDDPAGGLLPDDTLTFDYSQCTSECSITEAPKSLCFQKTAYFHSFLEGTYNKTGYVGSTYGRPEYVKEDPVLGPIYLWFYGEINPDDPSWIVSSLNLSRATYLREAGELIYVYGWCDADVANPVDCDASWRFYFNQWVVDDSVELVSGNCVEKDTLAPISWASHICIGLKDETLPSQSAYVSNSYFVGGYELDFLESAGISWPEDYYGADPEMEIYVKPKNDVVDYQVVIFWDPIFGMWHIGDPWRYATIVCPYDAGYSPLDCENWYDYDLVIMSNMNFYECTAADVVTKSPTSSPAAASASTSLAPGIIVVIVLAALFGVALIGVLVWWFILKKDTDKGQVTFEHPTEDMDGEKQTIPVQTTSQMDMSPLNNDGVDANEDDQL